MNIKRGDIYFIRPQATTGSEQRAGRPAVVVSNDMNNRCSTAVEVVYLTTQPKKDLPTHVTIRSAPQKSVALCEQIDTVATERIGTYAGHVSDTELMNLEIGMMISLGIDRATADIPEDLPHEMPDPVYPPPRGRTAGRACSYDSKVRHPQRLVRWATGRCADAA